MANQLVTPEWITREYLRPAAAEVANRMDMLAYQAVYRDMLATGTNTALRVEPSAIALPPMSTKTLVALAAAAAIASPRKISRRALLALGWKTR